MSQIAVFAELLGASDPANRLGSPILAVHSGDGTVLNATIPHEGALIGGTVSAWCLDCFYGTNAKVWDGRLTKDRSLHRYWTISPDPRRSGPGGVRGPGVAIQGSRARHGQEVGGWALRGPSNDLPFFLEAVSRTAAP